MLPGVYLYFRLIPSGTSLPDQIAQIKRALFRRLIYWERTIVTLHDPDATPFVIILVIVLLISNMFTGKALMALHALIVIVGH